MLPDKVSHGGTYAGNRVAAAAAVKTLEILRDTDALETIHATGRRDPGRARARSSTRRASPYHFTGHPSMFGIMFTETVATEYRDWANTDHELYDAIAIGMHARGAMPEPDSPRAVVHVRGARRRRHRRPGHGVLRLARRCARGRAHGGHAEPPAMRTGGRLTRSAMVLDGNAVRSVDRAAALLLALGETQGEAGVTELARRLGLHKSTASRLLATLQKRGLVEQDDETGKYRLGLVVIRLAERAERTLDLRGDRDARARAARAADARDDRARHPRRRLSCSPWPRPTARTSSPSATGPAAATPLHCVASRQGPARRRSPSARSCASSGAASISYTERTIVELEPLLEELARIRRRGYATAIGEYELGLNAVAAPVHDARGNVIAAVDVWGPAFRLTPRRVPELAAAGPRGRGGHLGPPRRHGRLARRPPRGRHGLIHCALRRESLP